MESISSHPWTCDHQPWIIQCQNVRWCSVVRSLAYICISAVFKYTLKKWWLSVWDAKKICQRSPMTQWSEQKLATVSSILIRATGFFLFILDNVTTLMGLLKPLFHLSREIFWSFTHFSVQIFYLCDCSSTAPSESGISTMSRNIYLDSTQRLRLQSQETQSALLKRHNKI